MEQVNRLGYELEIVNYDWKLRELRELGLPKLDGLVVMTGGGVHHRRRHQFSRHTGGPYVIFGRFLPGLALHSVSNDEEYTGAVAAHHLSELGYRKLAVLHSEPEGEGMTARTKGFRQFAELHGCSGRWSSVERGVEPCLSRSGADFGRARPCPAGGGGRPLPERKCSRKV